MTAYRAFIEREDFKADVMAGRGRRALAAKYGTSEKVARNAMAAVWATVEGGKPEAQPAATQPPAPHISESHKYDAQGNWNIYLPKTRICTLEQLIEHCKIDLTVWEIVLPEFNKWEVGAKDKAGVLNIEPLFQVKCKCRPRVNVIAARDEIRVMIEEAKSAAPIYPRTYHAKTEGVLLEIAVPDLHMGKLAWGEECGKDYDATIARALFTEAVDTLLRRAQTTQIERILFPVGNDLLNTDNSANTTTAGTPQTVDTRHQKTFRETRQMMVEAIERMREVAPVDVVMVAGNHDSDSVFYLGDALDCRFWNADDVTVINNAAKRKYYEYGRVMLLMTHGKGEKYADLPMLMANEQPEMWGRTRFREIHLGHLHKSHVDEKFGVRTRFISSLCATDDYHADHGFVGNIRSAEAFQWDRQQGMIGHLIFNAPDQFT